MVADTVAAPIEQQVNGVEDMLYMSSQCTNDGTYKLTVTFKLGINLNMAQVLVQNRVGLALPALPDVVKQTGVTVKKRSPDTDVHRQPVSPDGPLRPALSEQLRRDPDQGRNGAHRGRRRRDHVRPARLQHARLARSRKARRRAASRPRRVSAVREQNVQVAAGQIGQQPAPRGSFQYTMITLGRLTDPEQFANIIVKAGGDGRIIRLSRRGPRRAGAKNEDLNNYLDGKPSAASAVFQLPGANALDTADGVKAKMEELKKRFPRGSTTTSTTTPRPTSANRSARCSRRSASRHAGGHRGAGVPAELAFGARFR